jgi:hypothetical protein
VCLDEVFLGHTLGAKLGLIQIQVGNDETLAQQATQSASGYAIGYRLQFG